MPPLLLVLAAALATEPVAPPPDKPVTTFQVGGQYTVWGLVQHNFVLGAEHPLDDAAYVVQMLRLKAELGRPGYGAVARVDLGQGWWGVDNSPNTGTAVSEVEGTATGTTAYNPDALFGDKDTFYAVHVDIAYGWVALGPVRVHVGRQYFGVGHKLVLDENLDGVIASIEPREHLTVEASWALLSEGRGSLTTPVGALMSDAGDFSDAHLFGVRGAWDRKDVVHAELYALYLHDTVADDWTLLPNGLGYARSRFTPNVSRLGTFGASGSGRFQGLSWKAEADVLVGRDLVDNDTHAGGLLDRNDGSLFGWTGYVDLSQAFTAGIPMDAGLIAGIGSGDGDPTRGPGNVTKIATMGFFPFLHVWEDSVMPDVEGISPQGLGSPVSRGYREFENTTALAVRYGCRPVDRLRLEVVGAWLHATRPVHGFDATGTPTRRTASDLGFEVDGTAAVTVVDGMDVAAKFGWFAPGRAAALLINGTDAVRDPAWELKTEAGWKF